MALERNPDVSAPTRSLELHLTGNKERFNHLMLIDLSPKRLNGITAERALDRAAISCNKKSST